MEKIDLPLSEFTFAQKLGIMEDIWSRLSLEDQRLESPPWHKTVLDDRKSAWEEGTVKESDWDEAKDRIRKNISCK